MNQWIKLSFRNIIKNKRRSFVTLMAIAMGFTAINLFSGYTHSTYEGMRASAIRGSGIGHLTIYKKGWNKFGKSDPDKYMIDKKEINKIIKIIEENDSVILATPRLDISGIVSNGRNSTIFMAQGVIPADDKTILGTFFDFQPVTGKTLNTKKEYGVQMATDLAQYLQLKPEDDAVVMAATLDGQLNALDIQISGVYDTGLDAINDKFMKVPFRFAQSLYDSEKADRIVVLLDNWKNTSIVQHQIMKQLKDAGIKCEIKTWEELSAFYSNVKNMFDRVFLFIFSIVLDIVIMSTVNTMGMSVIERTREIGTLRALGIKKRGINMLFAIEGAMIGFIGSVVGVAFHMMIWFIIFIASPTYTPPGSSSPVPLQVDFLPGTIFFMLMCMIFLALIAAILPARRAANQNVVDALGHV
ncbi:MAG: FtsX-like permease family protein [Desulfobacteraceae bacterium]|nr:FtsX-like permease family protein [Desulfobacteraceae bacterium]